MGGKTMTNDALGYVPSWPGTTAVVLHCWNNPEDDVHHWEVRIIGWKIISGGAKPVFLGYVEDRGEYCFLKEPDGSLTFMYDGRLGRTHGSLEEAMEWAKKRWAEEREGR
jgi:hypothetical protein